VWFWVNVVRANLYLENIGLAGSDYYCMRSHTSAVNDINQLTGT
jgi:hypothetical protein